jgi:O-acetyl-ADP-ribose deacetylase (regulator of RNase III)
MIEHINGDIVSTKADLLINASNGKGWMGGFLGRLIKLKGVAQSIHYCDPSIEVRAKIEAKKLKVKSGDIFLTETGKLNFPEGILHAVTMDKPGQKSNLQIVARCLNNILKFCSNNNIKTAVLPILGAGTGKLEEKRCYRAL